MAKLTKSNIELYIKGCIQGIGHEDSEWDVGYLSACKMILERVQNMEERL